LSKDKKRAKLAEQFIGKIAYRLNLLGNDQRGAVTRAAIIQSIAVEGPLWGYMITTKAHERATKEALTTTLQASNFYKYIHPLIEKGYLIEKKIEKPIAGPERHLYDLTAKGSVLAMQMPYVRRHLTEFQKHKDPEDDHLYRLPGLMPFILWQQHGISEQLTDFVLKQAVRGVYSLGGLEDVDEETVREIWWLELAKALIAFQKLTPKEHIEMGLSKDEIGKAVKILKEDSEARQCMKFAVNMTAQIVDRKIDTLKILKEQMEQALEP
jgi:DNA-binding PadR family transcriptional regulator